jgi:GNAT superfamily N-acetyltransferase
MRLVPVAPDLAAAVAECYNDLVAPVPHCRPASPEQFASLEGLACRHLREERLMVAQEAPGEVRGFVHVGLVGGGLDYRPPQGPGTIRFLAYRPGERATGGLLLDWAEEWAAQEGCTVITAWNGSYPYPLYYSPGGAQLSEHLGHVRALFGQAGFQERGSEVLLTWRDFAPPELPLPSLPCAVALDWSDGPRLTVRAVRDGQELGWCIMDPWQTGLPGEEGSWCFCPGLHVEEPYQGQRLGSLLLATALREMRRGGHRHTALSTSWGNHRAVLMYTNMGYRHADRTCNFVKVLDESSELAQALRSGK